jgi:ribonucleoside-diphosphate reductase alpha chain
MFDDRASSTASSPDSAAQGALFDRGEDPGAAGMRVRKRNGRYESVDVNKIVRAVRRCSTGLPSVDVMRIAVRTIGGLFDGATTSELDRLSIHTAASLIAEEPEYSQLAARLLDCYISKEVTNQDIHSFSQSIAIGRRLGLIADATADHVASQARKLNAAASQPRDNFEYFGLRTVYDRYLLGHPTTRDVIETPSYFFLRVACGLSIDVADSIELFELMASHRYMPSSPTLFNSGTPRPQMSSCYLLDSPNDCIEEIYNRYADVARLSKYAGGIGLAYHRVRSRGSYIRGTNGHSNGVVSWLKTLDSSVAAVNQGGRRKGACCVYLECWHADVEEVLELKDNAGDEARRTYNLNLANWVPDLFMRRVEAGQSWSLFDPKTVPHLVDLYGDAFDVAYAEAEAAGLATRADATDPGIPAERSALLPRSSDRGARPPWYLAESGRLRCQGSRARPPLRAARSPVLTDSDRADSGPRSRLLAGEGIGALADG